VVITKAGMSAIPISQSVREFFMGKTPPGEKQREVA
jgi:hypothetical protein